ncbi:zinc-dependent metalloprotease [Dyadobacter tibetensis]|uniref:zinc-dependent metalloprotease n=1 Tax=Dyadobacter tibetensis TaxID=1211851 RepID=UPI000472C47B|nr:zinc-dependent metalloprotease [Dyadobacter tibetensis]
MNAANTIRVCVSLILFLIVGSEWACAQLPLPHCGTDDALTAATLRTYTVKNDLSSARVASQELLEYRLALDINYQTYLLYSGDTTKIKLVANEFIEKASQIFQRDVRIKLTVSSILIWKKPEPYMLASDMDFYTNVLTYWNMNRKEVRDAVISLSVRSGWFYGGTRMATSNFPGPGSPDLSVDILAHELGHTLGSPHTHSCSWPGGPIDYCELVEGDDNACQSNFKEYTNGTIMSYCRSIMQFHPLCQNIMRAQAEGKIYPDFKLKPLIGILQTGDLTIINNQEKSSNRPIMHWKPADGAREYQLQIARNSEFTSLATDTLLGQSIYQSTGLGSGTYYARYRIINVSGTSLWSKNFSFSVLPFSPNTVPPVLNNINLTNKGLVTGWFAPYIEADRYQLMILNLNNPKQYFTYDRQIEGDGKQTFILPLSMPLYGWYSIKIRLGNDANWSQWSEGTTLNNPWNGSFWEGNMLSENTSTPLIATTLFQPALQRGHQQSMEIATDNSFKNIVFSDSIDINKVHDYHTNKVLFKPILSEHTRYYARTRMRYAAGTYTGWDSTSFLTGWKDQRFQYLGSVASSPLPTSSYGPDFSPCYFFKTQDQLYVFTNNRGYYSSTDALNWKPTTVRSTKGKSPDYLRRFVATNKGETYTIDHNYTVTWKNGDHFKTYPPPKDLYSHGLSSAVVIENEHLFFGTSTRGVAHFQNGVWQFYGKHILKSDQVLVLAQGGNTIWVVMEEGGVWQYDQGKWHQKPILNQWRGLKGLTIDLSGHAYAYGDWGVSKLRSGGAAWEEVPGLSSYPIQKLILDSLGNIWMASYRFEGSKVVEYALLKASPNQIIAYRDGLAFFREPFDLTFFQNKLLILTAGGDIHQFEEDNIQRYSPPSSYCGGEQVLIEHTSNSTLPKNANLHLELIREPENIPTTFAGLETGAITLPPVRTKAGQNTFLLPKDVATGSYRIRTVLEHPEIWSPKSTSFTISKEEKPVVALGQRNQHSIQLFASPASYGNAYQWMRDGQELAGETHTKLTAFQDGNYTLRSTNSAGCTGVSEPQAISIEFPEEITLLQNFPNPVQTSTKIGLYIPSPQNIRLELMNRQGMVIHTFIAGHIEKGWHNFPLEATSLPAGIFLYRLSAENYEKSLKLVKE